MTDAERNLWLAINDLRAEHRSALTRIAVLERRLAERARDARCGKARDVCTPGVRAA